MAQATVEHHLFGPTANAAPRGQTTGTSVREAVESEANDVPRHQKPPPPGTRPERLVDARGPQGGWSVRLTRALKPTLLSPVVMVQEAAHDDITAAFLLTQSLRQRQEEVEDAKTGREEDVEEDDRLVEYFSVVCVFLEMLENVWQSHGHGVARLLRDSRGAVIFQFWLGDRPGRSGRVWAWSDPEYTGGPSEYGHAVRFASQELARRFHHEWAATG